ncbi:MAG: YdcF family protein [Candidatus Nanopusillus sp.]
MTYITNIFLPNRERKSKELNSNLDSILNNYNSGNPRNYENKNTSYPQTPYYHSIIVLGGGPEHTAYRLEKAIELYKQGIADYLIVTVGESDVSIAKKIIKNTGIDKYIVDDRSTTTLHNALYAKEILHNLHAPKGTLVAILTEEPHCDRAIDTFNLIFRGKYRIDTICIKPLPDPYMWDKEEKIKRIRKYIHPLYPLLINSLTYSEKYLSYLPRMNEEKAEKMVDKFIKSTSDTISYLFNTSLKYANKVREYINKIIGSYRSYVNASPSS